jgi:NAD(P)-dependent dehydrogenase (short-subunit alcohol dehydrogenase family)
MSRSLAGRAALVTGAGNGLGRAISRSLAAAGAHVILVGRDGDKLARAAAELRLSGASARAVAGDVSDPDAVARLHAELSDEDISILVNNAGIGGPVAQLCDVDPAAWDEVFAINVRGVFLMCRAFLPEMIARRAGDIINIASVTGKRPLPGRTPYAASKMAVIGLTATLAQEVGPLGVMVNSLSPGYVRGPRMERNFRLEAARRGITEQQVQDDFVARTALGRMLGEDEVGNAVVAILSMRGLTAADVDLSGGMVAR